MDPNKSKAIAMCALQLVEKSNMPASRQNLDAAHEVHEMLGAMIRGELILVSNPPGGSVNGGST